MTDAPEGKSAAADAVTSDSNELIPDEVESLEEADPEPPSVSYKGTDFDAEGLVRRLERGDIIIPTFGHDDDSTIVTERFQRGFVWSKPQMDRFVESLLLGYPIPGIFLVQQSDKRYLVLDGQQRLRTLAEFYSGVHDKKVFSLQNVAKQFVGLTYATLPAEYRRTVDSTFIQATIVETDGSVRSLDAVYQVFERLNSGGTQLKPHEIRVALYAGPFIQLLDKLNNDENRRALYGRKSPRLRDQEVVLRAIALFVSSVTYSRREQVARRVSVCFTPAAFAATVRHSHILPPSSFCAQDEDGAKARGGPAGPGGDEVRQRYGDRDGEQHLGGGAGRVGEVGPGPRCAVPKLADSR